MSTEREKKYQRERRAAFKARGICIRCRTNKTVTGSSNCKLCNTKGMDYWRKHRERFLPLRKIKHQVLRLEVFTAYGGAFCACCKESHLEFLSVNHLNGDGATHRKAMGWKDGTGGGGGNIYGWLKTRKFPPGFNILCMNCNFALGHSGYCPHTR